jgi:acetyltransferase-like isoleucine patch superfamily enzyme
MIFGKYTYGVDNITIKWENDNAKLYIGNFCSIAKNITVYLGGNHRTDLITTYPFGHIYQNVFNTFDGKGLSNNETTKGNVFIGNDVWIGDNVTIMSGISIGDGSVIATNSHVVKNVEPYSIYGGNPAKLIHYRFSQDIIQKLLEIKWWYFDEITLNNNLPLLMNEDINKFIDKFTN